MDNEFERFRRIFVYPSDYTNPVGQDSLDMIGETETELLLFTLNWLWSVKKEALYNLIPIILKDSFFENLFFEKIEQFSIAVNDIRIRRDIIDRRWEDDTRNSLLFVANTLKRLCKLYPSFLEEFGFSSDLDLRNEN